jgi:hypothetical protein
LHALFSALADGLSQAREDELVVEMLGAIAHRNAV